MLEPVHVIEEVSRRRPSITPEGPTQPRQRQRVGGSARSAAPHALRLHALPPQTTASLPAATGRSSCLRPASVRWSAAATTGALAREAQRASTGHRHAVGGLLVVWLRGGFGRGAGASPAGLLYHMDWLEDIYSKVGPSGVSPPVHERSHGNAHAHRLRIAWQVVGSLKRASHESIPSIHQLRE